MTNSRREYNQKYYIKTRQIRLEKARKYRKEHPDKIKKWWRENYPKRKDLYNKNRYEQHHRNYELWRDFVFKTDHCEICGKKVYYAINSYKNSVNFDHKKPNVSIKGNPMAWLRVYRNKKTPETERIWTSCDFGILCTKCNRFLPTKNRKEFVRSLVKYVFKGGSLK